MRPRAFLLLSLAAATAAHAAAPLAIDLPNSRVEIDVKATMDSFTGHLERFAPEVAVDDAGHVSAARLKFAFADLKTGKAKRDQAMHEWQQTSQYPDGEFTLESLQPAAENQFIAHGTLRLHGVTQQIEFPVSIISDQGVYAIDGDAPLDTRKFGLPVIRVMAVLKVDPELHVRFHLQGRKAS